MNQSLFPENNLLNFTKPSLALYVEDSHNRELNSFIQSNYHQIVDYYSAKEIDFCYLPYLLNNTNYREIINYNRPYLSKDFDKNSITEIYSRIIIQQSKAVKGAGLVFFKTYYDNKDAILSTSINENNSLIEQFLKFADLINETLNIESQVRKSDKKLMCRIIRPKNEDAFNFEFLNELNNVYEREINESRYNSNVNYSVELNADNQFDCEAYRLAEEIRNRIKLLKETGSLSLIGDILEEIHETSQKLSKVFITNDYRIFLKDFSMKEVEMAPLPKSVFILFLHHPEGIPFKKLADYYDELLSIYRNITVHENIDRVMESIRALTDPLNASINEKCSRIRAAFLEVIADNLAQNYYVTGKRGEPKKIILDRSLVEFQK